MAESDIQYTRVGDTYTLTKVAGIKCAGWDFGTWKAYGVGARSGKLFIEAKGDTLYIYPGYQWDGCTGAPTSGWNVRPSLVHDALYQAKKCGANTLSWYKIDSLFRVMMKQDGADLFHRNLYYYGVKIFGLVFKFEKLNSLRIVHAE